MKKGIYLQWIMWIMIIVPVIKPMAQTGQTWREIQYFQITSRPDGILTGGSVCVRDNFAIIGKDDDYYDQNGQNQMEFAGSAYIFKRDNNGNWVQQQKIVADDRSAYSNFGLSVSIYGDYAIIGAPKESHLDENNNLLYNAGAAYIFKRDNTGNWNQIKKLITSDGASLDYFGSSVSIFNNYIIIGAPQGIGGPGKVYIYNYDDQSHDWIEYIYPSPFMADFGCSVSITEDFAIVGAPGWGGLSKGYAYVYKKDDNGVFQFNTTIANPSNDFYYFGQSVAIEDNRAIIGAPRSISNNGSVSVYEFDGTWDIKQIIVTPLFLNGLSYKFGYSVALSGDNIVIGCPEETYWSSVPGYVFLYTKNGSGIWPDNPQQLIGIEEETDDCFGKSVSVSGNYCFTSSFGSLISGEWVNGAFYIFRPSDELVAHAGDDRIICQGDQTTLGGSPAATGGVLPYVYSWSTVPASSWSSTLENPPVNPTSTTNYHLNVTDYNGLGLSATDDVKVTVDPQCSCEYPFQISATGNIQPLEIANDINGNVFALSRYDGNHIMTSYCNFMDWYFLQPGNKLIISSTDRHGVIQGITGVVAEEQNSGVKPVIISSNNSSFVALTSAGTVSFKNGPVFNTPNKSITIFSTDLYCNLNWVHNIYNNNNGADVSNCDITQDDENIYLVGTAKAGTQIGNISMQWDGVFLSKIQKSTGNFLFSHPFYNISINSKPSLQYFFINPTKYLAINLSGLPGLYDINNDTYTPNPYPIYSNSYTRDRIVKGDILFYIQQANTIWGLQLINGVFEQQFSYTSPSTVFDIEPFGDDIYFSYLKDDILKQSAISHLDLKGHTGTTYPTNTPVFFTLLNAGDFGKGYTVKSIDQSTLAFEGFYIPFADMICKKLIADAGLDQNFNSCVLNNITIGGNPTGSGGSGHYSYYWNAVPSDPSLNPTISNPVVQPLVNTLYTVTVTDMDNPNNCKTDEANVNIVLSGGNWPISFIPPVESDCEVEINSNGSVAGIFQHINSTNIGNQMTVYNPNPYKNVLICAFDKCGSLYWANSLSSPSFFWKYGIMTLTEDNTTFILTSPSEFISDVTGILYSSSSWHHFLFLLKVSQNGEKSYIVFDNNPDGEISYRDMVYYRNALYISGECSLATSFGNLNPVNGSYILKLDLMGTPLQVVQLPVNNNMWSGGLLTINNEKIFVEQTDEISIYDMDLNLIDTQYPFTNYPNNGLRFKQFETNNNNDFYLVNYWNSTFFPYPQTDLIKLNYNGNTFDIIGYYPSLAWASIGSSDEFIYQTSYTYQSISNPIMKLNFSLNPQIIWEIFPQISLPSNQVLSVKNDYSNGVYANRSQVDIFNLNSGEQGKPIIIASVDGLSEKHSLDINTENHDDIIVFPNPSKRLINCYIKEKNKENGTITIIDNLGRRVKTIKNILPNINYQINLFDLPDGLYIIKFQTQERTLWKKLVICS